MLQLVRIACDTHNTHHFARMAQGHIDARLRTFCAGICGVKALDGLFSLQNKACAHMKLSDPVRFSAGDNYTAPIHHIYVAAQAFHHSIH